MTYYTRNLLVLSCTVFMAAVSWNQVVPFLPLFLQELGVRHNLAQWSGLVFAMQSTAGIVMQPLWGSLGDRYGRKPMVLRAGVSLVAIYALMSVCRTPWQLAGLRFMNGALTGFIPGSFTLIATNTPEELAPRYVAIAQTANAAGGILGPAVGSVLAQAMGYRGSMRASAVAVAMAVAVVFALVQEPNKAAVTKPTNIVDDFRVALTNPVMLTVMVVTFFAWAIGAAVQPVLAIYLEQLHSGQVWLSGLVFSLPGIAFMVTGYRWARIGERAGYHRAMVWGLLGSGAFMASLSFVRGLGLFSAGYFAMGLFAAALGPCSAAVIAIRIDNSFRGRAYGIQQSAGTLGGLVAPISAGVIGGYIGIRWVFFATGAATVVGAAIVSGMTRRWTLEAKPGGCEQQDPGLETRE